MILCYRAMSAFPLIFVGSLKINVVQRLKTCDFYEYVRSFDSWLFSRLQNLLIVYNLFAKFNVNIAALC